MIESQDALRAMLTATTILSPAEKQYWFSLLPTMNQSQMDQLKNLIETEEKNLAAIDEKYDDKLKNVAEKYLKRWDAERLASLRKERQTKEAVEEAEESKKEEALLSQFT